MIITCDECNSNFNVNNSLVKEAGSKVRCSKCNSVFMAFPQPTENIQEPETAENDLALDYDDQMLEKDEEFGLGDLDSDLGDFLEDEKKDETLAMSSDIEEYKLDLDDFNDTLGAETILESDKVLEETEGELELDLDLDDNSDPKVDEESIAGDDLPNIGHFEDLADLDEEEITTNEPDSELEVRHLALASETNAELELEGDDGLDLTDLELQNEVISALEEPSAEDNESLEAEESDELDLSDLELSLDDETDPEDTVEIGSKELSLDLEAEEQGAAKITEAGLEIEAADKLDLSDLDLEMDNASESDGASAAESDDLNLELNLNLEGETVAGREETGTDELDLSDLTDIMENEEAPIAEAKREELDLELDLASDTSTGGNVPAADSGDIDELDLSDLEDFLESEEAPAANYAADESAQDLEMDLDFQIDEDPHTTEAATTSQSNDELDFSDLEQMLESDETPSVEAASSNDNEELDLQFDLDKPPAEGLDTVPPGDAGAAAQDDDFLDIEQLLDEGEDSVPSGSAGLDGNVTDLPLEMEAALDDASKAADAELELDFDLETELQAKEDLFDTNESTDHQLKSNLLTSEEVDILDETGIEETEFQNGSETSVISSDDFATDEFNETDTAYGATHVSPGSENELPIADSLKQAPTAHKPQKDRSKKPVLVAVLLFLLAIGVMIIPNMLGIKIPYISDIKIPYLSNINVKIPYLSEWLNPEPQDVAGNLKIIPLGNTINGNFVDNAKFGQLFVIQGQIKNDYDHPRSYIKVTGKLYLKGKKVAKKATVYCGNLLSDSDLATMNIATINKKLSIRSGDNRSNFKVETGQRVPFMIVFDKLPHNLDEYTVEVEGSSI